MIETQPHWRDIPGYEGSYQIHPLGTVRSLDREIETSTGPRQLKGCTLMTRLNAKGERQVNLSKDGRMTTWMIKSLLGRTFPDQIDGEGPYLVFKQGSRTEVGNLKWVDEDTLAHRRHKPTTKDTSPVAMCHPKTHRTLRTFGSVKEAVNFLGLPQTSNIYHVLNGHYRTAYGYYWRRIPDET